MNDFKYCAGWAMGVKFENINWGEIVTDLDEMFVKTTGSNYSQPIELMSDLLNK